MRVLPILLLLVLVAAPAAGQPSLDQLWPSDNGKTWTYDGIYDEAGLPSEVFTGRLIFDGESMMSPGVTVQNLVGQIDGTPASKLFDPATGRSALVDRLWIARPELRPALQARSKLRKAIFWPSTLLSPNEVAFGTGHRQTSDTIGAWRDMIGDWSWWMVTGDLTAGSTFRLQLLPDLTSDVFLNGTLRGTAESVSTGAGSWTDAVVVDYVVELGTGSIADETGNIIGTVVSEIRGWVAFVPAVGPVASDERFTFVSVDCPTGCPEEDLVGATVTRTQLSLRTAPVPRDAQSWGELKTGW